MDMKNLDAQINEIDGKLDEVMQEITYYDNLERDLTEEEQKRWDGLWEERENLESEIGYYLDEERELLRQEQEAHYKRLDLDRI